MHTHVKCFAKEHNLSLLPSALAPGEWHLCTFPRDYTHLSRRRGSIVVSQCGCVGTVCFFLGGAVVVVALPKHSMYAIYAYIRVV